MPGRTAGLSPCCWGECASWEREGAAAVAVSCGVGQTEVEAEREVERWRRRPRKVEDSVEFGRVDWVEDGCCCCCCCCW